MTPHEPTTPSHPMDAPLELTAGELTAGLSDQSAAGVGKSTPLPATLAARIVADGTVALRRQRLGVASPVVTARARSFVSPAWWVAAAAVIAWLLLPSPFASPSAGVAIATAPMALRDSLLADSSTLRVAWASSVDPAGRTASGEVLWSGARQRGVMRFKGLVRNDPRVAQYQLWIVDAERDARYPVDGGVFDVTSEGELLVPIQARLAVGRPTLFAVTLEPPGGVVVSNRERLVLAAPVG